MAPLFGGGPTAYCYGASELPAEMATNAAKYGVTVPGQAGAAAIAAGMSVRNPMVGLVVLAVVLWLLAERHASLRAGGGGSLKGAVKLT